MAKIRIVDSWMRSPIAAVTWQRAVMVVAESWAEQRVLMQAFANNREQTAPTIRLQDRQLPIGPASSDPYGSWGVHVEEDGDASALRDALESAARQLVGSKGTPQRLADEKPLAEKRATIGGGNRAVKSVGAKPTATRKGRTTLNGFMAVVPLKPQAGASVGMPARGGHKTPNRKRRENVKANLASLVGRTMPVGFNLSKVEREVLEKVGQARRISAPEVASITGVANGIEWMEQFMAKLAGYGLDLIVLSGKVDGNATFSLRQ